MFWIHFFYLDDRGFNVAIYQIEFLLFVFHQEHPEPEEPKIKRLFVYIKAAFCTSKSIRIVELLKNLYPGTS